MAHPKLTIEPDKLKVAYDDSKSLRQMAELLERDPRTIHRILTEQGYPLPAAHWEARSVKRSNATVEYEMTDDEMVNHLRTQGYTLSRATNSTDFHRRIETKSFDGLSFRIGVVSDTHLGGVYQQLTHLHTAYDVFAHEGIDTVIHGGDFCAGSVGMHPGYVYELHQHGADAQREYAIREYPKREGITTYAISGSHDHSHIKSGGVNVMLGIAEKRNDIVYLGRSGAYLTIHDVTFYIHHPSGGVAYARSYRLQKIIEQFAPEKKPNILVCGHLHVTCVLEMYRNVFGFIAGCFESQTPYLVEKHLYPEVGFSILDIVADADGLIRIKKEWIPFYEPIPHDY